MEQKFSLFTLEKRIYGHNGEPFDLFGKDFSFSKTFDTLEEAQEEQKKYHVRTIILPSY